MGPIFEPVKLTSLNQVIFTVEVALPTVIQEELTRYGNEDMNSSWALQAQNAILFYRESFMTREDHAREHIAWALENFGPPERKKRLSVREIKETTRRANEELSALKEAGAIGNLGLPKESYEFVREKVRSGEFTSPTEVLLAAMDSLRAERGKSPRADFA